MKFAFPHRSLALALSAALALCALPAVASDSAAGRAQAGTAAPQDYRDMLLASAKLLGMLPGLVRTCHSEDKALLGRAQRLLEASEAQVLKDFGAQAREQYRAALGQGQELYQESLRSASPQRISAMCESSAKHTEAMLRETERSMGLAAAAQDAAPAQTAPTSGAPAKPSSSKAAPQGESRKPGAAVKP